MLTNFPIDAPLPAEFWHRLEAGELVPFCGIGNSMRPFFPSHTWFLLRRDPVVHLRVGDLVLMKNDTKTMLHRITRIDKASNDIIVTRGDAYREDDPNWEFNDYRARVVEVIGAQGKWQSELTRYHKLICILYRWTGPATRHAISTMRSIRRFTLKS